MKNVIEVLKTYYQSFINQLTGRDFFVGLAEYIKYAIGVPEIGKIIEIINKEKADADKEFKKYEIRAAEELKEIYKKLFKKIKEEKIARKDIENLTKFTQKWDDYEKGIVGTSEPTIESLSGLLTGFIRYLHEGNYKNIVKDFIETDQENYIKNYTCFKNVNLYYKADEEYEEKRKIGLWGAWDKLFLVYEVIFNRKELLERYKKNRWTYLNLQGIIAEMKKIINSSISDPAWFKKENYISHASRIHNYLLKELDLQLTRKEEAQRPIRVFTNEVISDRTAEIEKQMQEGQIRWSERIERERLHREQMKQDRILRTPVDKYTHALDLIIERAEYAEDGNSFSIEFYDFNFEQMISSRILEKFLTEMQKDDCFEKYTRQNYGGGTRFGFIKPSVKKLKEFKEKREIKKPFPSTTEENRAFLEAIKRRLGKIRERKEIKDEILAEIRKEQEKQQISPEVVETMKKKIERLEKAQENNQRKIQGNKNPFCIVENNWGYLKFDRYGEKIKIGTPKSRHFRLLEYLLEPFGKAKTIETVYDWIKLPKDRKDSDLSGWDNYKKKGRQITIIQNTIKELQKDNKLRGKLAFEFDDTKNKIWVKPLE